MSFVVFDIPDRGERLPLESRMTSTLSVCTECKSSEGWLGLFSPKDRIRGTGLWLVNELLKEPLADAHIEHLEAALR